MKFRVLFLLVLILHTISVYSSFLLTGGSFEMSRHNSSVSFLSLYDTTTDQFTPYYAEKPDGPVHVAVYEPKCDFLLIGGEFTSIDGVETGPVAVKFGASKNFKNMTENPWRPLSAFSDDVFTGQWSNGASVRDIKLFYGNVLKRCSPSIVIVGSFTKASGISNVNNIVMLDTVTFKWETFEGSDIPKVKGVKGESINCVLVNNNYFYVGGNFSGYFKRYSNGKWQTLLQGQLDGPVNWMVLQNNKVYDDIFLVGGYFTSPATYFFMYSPSRSIDTVKRFKKTRILLDVDPEDYPLVDATTFGVRDLDVNQDRLYMIGVFSYQKLDGGVYTNFFGLNIVDGFLSRTPNMSLPFTSSIPHAMALCKPPFVSCNRGSMAVAKRDFITKNNMTVYSSNLTISLFDNDLSTTATDIEFTLEDSSESQIISTVMFLPFSASINLCASLTLLLFCFLWTL